MQMQYHEKGNKKGMTCEKLRYKIIVKRGKQYCDYPVSVDILITVKNVDLMENFSTTILKGIWELSLI